MTPDLSYLHRIGCTAVNKIPDAKRVKFEKFEAAGVKCRFLGYEGTNFRLWDGEKVIISIQTHESTPSVKSYVDELDCIPVELAKVYEPEIQFPGGSPDEADADQTDVGDNVPDDNSPTLIRDEVSDPQTARNRQPP